MDCFQQIPAANHFTRKKAFVTYLLSVFVFWIHTASFSNYDAAPVWYSRICTFLTSILPSVAVPLFFILSGALFFHNYRPTSYRSKLTRRVHTLVIPYFLWNIIMLLFQIVATSFFSQYFFMRIPFDFTWKSVLQGLFHWKYNNPFWYVFSLFLFAVASPALALLLRTRLIAFSSVLLLTVLCQLQIGLPQPLFYDRTCIVYYLIGGICGRFYWDRLTADTHTSNLLPSLSGILLCLACLFAVTENLVPYSPALSILINTVYALCLWIFCDFLCARIPVYRFMEHSF